MIHSSTKERKYTKNHTWIVVHIFRLTGHYLMKHLFDRVCTMPTCTSMHRGLIAGSCGGTLCDTTCWAGSIHKYQMPDNWGCYLRKNQVTALFCNLQNNPLREPSMIGLAIIVIWSEGVRKDLRLKCEH